MRKKPEAPSAETDPLFDLDDLDIADVNLDDLDIADVNLDDLGVAGDTCTAPSAPTPPAPGGTVITLKCETSASFPAPEPVVIKLHGDAVGLLDHARRRSGYSRTEFINRLVLDNFAPNPLATPSKPLRQLVEIAATLAPAGWGFGVKKLDPVPDVGGKAVYLAHVSTLSVRSIHPPRHLLTFANDLRCVAKEGGQATLTSLNHGTFGAEYTASRSGHAVIIRADMNVDGEHDSSAKLTTSSRDIEKTARFFEYLAVIVSKARHEAPEGF